MLTNQAAEYVGVTRWAILKALKKNRILGAEKVGRDWLIPVESVVAFKADIDGKPRRGPKPRDA